MAHAPSLSAVLSELYYPFQTFDFTSWGLISNITLLGQVSPMFYDLSNTQLHHCYDFHLLTQSSIHLTHHTENPWGQEPCLCCSRLEPQCPEERMILSGCSKNIWERNTEGENGRAEREKWGKGERKVWRFLEPMNYPGLFPMLLPKKPSESEIRSQVSISVAQNYFY